MYQQLKEDTPLTSTEAKCKKSYVDRFVNACCSIVTWLIGLIIFNLMAIAAIVIGIVFFDTKYCPDEPDLAGTLIVSGSLGILLSGLEGRLRIQAEKGENAPVPPNWVYHLRTFLRISKFFVFIYLCYLVFTLYSARDVFNLKSHSQDQVVSLGEVEGHAQPSLQSEAKHYCHPTLYFFAFWTVLIALVLSTLALFFAGSVYCIRVLESLIHKTPL